MAFKELLATEFAPFGVISPRQLELLDQHYSLLTRWNKSLNLTRIVDFPDAVRFHYCESLFVAKALPDESLHIVDVGSGAGFPGIPIAIARPDCYLDLVESHQRKAVFLQEAARELRNVRVLPQRAEQCEPGYDWMVSRAVRPSSVLAARLSARAALLLGVTEAAALPAGFETSKIPWGEQRVLAIGIVPRETLGRT